MKKIIILVSYTVITGSSTIQVTCSTDKECLQAAEAIQKDQDNRQARQGFCNALKEQYGCREDQ